jgi:hypothetical protein
MFRKIAASCILITLLFGTLWPNAGVVFGANDLEIVSVSPIQESEHKNQGVKVTFNRTLADRWYPHINADESWLRKVDDGKFNYTDKDYEGMGPIREMIRTQILINGKTVGEIMQEAEAGIRPVSVMIHISGNEMSVGLAGQAKYKWNVDGKDAIEFLDGFVSPKGDRLKARRILNLKGEGDKMGELPQFYSSDEGLDRFLNEYFEKHLRYNKNRIHPHPVGASDMFNKEWEAMSLMWFDSTDQAMPDNRQALMRRWLTQVPVDRFGYTWSGFYRLQNPTSTKSPFQQGWPFPDYHDSAGNSNGWEFNGSLSEWTLEDKYLETQDGFMKVPLKGKRVELVSPSRSLDGFHAPFLEIDYSITGPNGEKAAIDSIKVYWKTLDEEEYSEDKSADLLRDRTLDLETDLPREWIHIPLYLNEKWKGQHILEMKIVFEHSSEMNLTADVNFIRLNYDSRHANNLNLLITGSAYYYMWTGEEAFLVENMPRLRKATQFYLTHLQGAEGLTDRSYFNGHDGIRGVGHGIGNGFWDIISWPPKDTYTNVYFYRAIDSMMKLEQIAEQKQFEIERPSVLSPDMKSTVPYEQNSETLAALKRKIEEEFRKDVKDGGFWDPDKGRFIMGFTADGKALDYGYIMINLEIVASGLASEEQAAAIMEWVDGRRIIEGEKSTGEDIYFFRFAPRVSTIKNDKQYKWKWNGASREFGDQVQDGGTTAFVAYYDLVSRVNVLGADNAFKRLKAMQAWFDDVRAAGGEGQQFYREYYKNVPNVTMQGGGSSGGIGLDYEFVEASLLYSAIPLGFFGMEAEGTSGVAIRPNMPSGLDFWRIKNMYYHKNYFDVEMRPDELVLNNMRGDYKVGRDFYVKLKKPKFEFEILRNGEPFDQWEEINGNIVVKVPFAEVALEQEVRIGWLIDETKPLPEPEPESTGSKMGTWVWAGIVLVLAAAVSAITVIVRRSRSKGGATRGDGKSSR